MLKTSRKGNLTIISVVVFLLFLLMSRNISSTRSGVASHSSTNSDFQGGHVNLDQSNQNDGDTHQAHFQSFDDNSHSSNDDGKVNLDGTGHEHNDLKNQGDGSSGEDNNSNENNNDNNNSNDSNNHGDNYDNEDQADGNNDGNNNDNNVGNNDGNSNDDESRREGDGDNGNNESTGNSENTPNSNNDDKKDEEDDNFDENNYEYIEDYSDVRVFRENATFVTLVKNKELKHILQSINEVEKRFNHIHHYDWVFLNEEPFTANFIKLTSSRVSGTAKYGRIRGDQWRYPDFIDQSRAEKSLRDLKDKVHGGELSYRHMCRYESGFFWRHPLLRDYKYYWRVEPRIRIMCDVREDPFRLLRERNKIYGFTIAIREHEWSIPTLWNTVRGFMEQYPQYINQHNAMRFISDDNGGTYNLCHFWSNFEIGDLDFFRSPEYLAFFEYLDGAGGFYYERWGDAPVHTIAVSLLADRDQLHWFENIGYFHEPFQNCPIDKEVRKELRCSCPNDVHVNPDWTDSLAFMPNSCISEFLLTAGQP